MADENNQEGGWPDSGATYANPGVQAATQAGALYNFANQMQPSAFSEQQRPVIQNKIYDLAQKGADHIMGQSGDRGMRRLTNIFGDVAAGISGGAHGTGFIAGMMRNGQQRRVQSENQAIGELKAAQMLANMNADPKMVAEQRKAFTDGGKQDLMQQDIDRKTKAGQARQAALDLQTQIKNNAEQHNYELGKERNAQGAEKNQISRFNAEVNAQHQNDVGERLRAMSRQGDVANEIHQRMNDMTNYYKGRQMDQQAQQHYQDLQMAFQKTMLDNGMKAIALHQHAQAMGAQTTVDPKTGAVRYKYQDENGSPVDFTVPSMERIAAAMQYPQQPQMMSNEQLIQQAMGSGATPQQQAQQPMNSPTMPTPPWLQQGQGQMPQQAQPNVSQGQPGQSMPMQQMQSMPQQGPNQAQVGQSAQNQSQQKPQSGHQQYTPQMQDVATRARALNAKYPGMTPQQAVQAVLKGVQ